MVSEILHYLCPRIVTSNQTKVISEDEIESGIRSRLVPVVGRLRESAAEGVCVGADE